MTNDPTTAPPADAAALLAECERLENLPATARPWKHSGRDFRGNDHPHHRFLTGDHREGDVDGDEGDDGGPSCVGVGVGVVYGNPTAGRIPGANAELATGAVNLLPRLAAALRARIAAPADLAALLSEADQLLRAPSNAAREKVELDGLALVRDLLAALRATLTESARLDREADQLLAERDEAHALLDEFVAAAGVDCGEHAASLPSGAVNNPWRNALAALTRPAAPADLAALLSEADQLLRAPSNAAREKVELDGLALVRDLLAALRAALAENGRLKAGN